MLLIWFGKAITFYFVRMLWFLVDALDMFVIWINNCLNYIHILNEIYYCHIMFKNIIYYNVKIACFIKISFAYNFYICSSTYLFSFFLYIILGNSYIYFINIYTVSYTLLLHILTCLWHQIYSQKKYGIDLVLCLRSFFHKPF